MKKGFNDFYKDNENYFGKAPSDGLVETIKKYNITPNGKALDIGAGEGRNSNYLDEIGYEVTAVEPEIEGINKIIKNSNIETVHSDFESFNTTDKFNFILAGTVLDQLPANKIQEAADKIISLMNTGGIAYILVFTVDDPEASECSNTIGHYFNKNELLEIFTKHRNIEVMFYDEYMKIDESHGPVHYHGKAKLIFKKL